MTTTETPVPSFSYPKILRNAQRQSWKIDDLIGPEHALDFTRPFLPEGLARAYDLDFLSARERLLLNQIRGHGYLHTFGLVEEFILPFVLDHARSSLAQDDARTRALLQFASEEAKHIQLFKAFAAEFARGFGHACDAIGPPEEIAREVFSKPALSVALLTLHIEWMTQRHYLESTIDDGTLDPRFKRLLEHHWKEEAQHAQLDTLMVEELVAHNAPDDCEAALQGYLELGIFIDGGLLQQAAFDLASLERASGRVLEPVQKQRFLAQQHQALRWTFLGSGMTHPRFLATLDSVHPDARLAVEAVAPTFS